MPAIDLNFIYEQLKDEYDVQLADSMDLDLDLWVDTDVLFAKTDNGFFYLYNDFEDGTILIENADKTARCNLYPDDTPEAQEYIAQFLEDRAEYKMTPYSM